MNLDILISGFGGQGIMSLGKFMAEVGLAVDKQVSFFPSYGAEMRGGTAHCFVRISDSAIGSPFIEACDIAVIMNQPSLVKFKNRLNEGALIIINQDLIAEDVSYLRAKTVSLSLNKLAIGCGNIKVANVIALGVISEFYPAVFDRKVIGGLIEGLFKNKEDILKANLSAFEKGRSLAKEI